jgi:hypothetical protein
MSAYIKQGRRTSSHSVEVSVWFTSFTNLLKFIIQQIIKPPAVETYVKSPRRKGKKIIPLWNVTPCIVADKYGLLEEIFYPEDGNKRILPNFYGSLSCYMASCSRGP